MKQNKKSFYDHISMTCFKYAPESFKASYNGKPIQLEYDETSKCGYAFCCGGREKAITELKKIIRGKIKRNREYCTIGFYDAENKKQYHFTQQLKATFFNIADMLYIYKDFKRDIMARNCKIESYTQATLNGQFKPEHVETKYDIIDINKPLIIHFINEKRYILA